MNELSKVFLNIDDGQTVVLEKDKVYDVRQDDSFLLDGYFCTNTAKKHENPDGRRNVAIFIKEKKNITIDGNGATVLVHGKMTPLLFDRCESITVKNLTVDYACPTMAEFAVTDVSDGVHTIKINDDCLFRIENNELVWQGETGADGKPYWEDSYIGNRRHIKLYNPENRQCSDFRRDDLAFDTVSQEGENILKVVFKNPAVSLPENSVIQTRNIVRDQTGSLFNRCKNLLFENNRIRFMHGLGMVSQFCENVTYRNCDLTPKAGRTIASTADFFQFSGCKGKLIVDACKAYGAQDDYINVHGTHLRVVEKDDESNALVVRFCHDESWGFQAFEAGDILEFIRWDTLKPYAETKVVGYEKLSDTDIRLILDRNLPDDLILGKDVVENVTWTPDLYVRNCSFGPTSGRGILATTRGEVIIENNEFNTLWGPALLIEDDCNFWFESGYTTNIIFRNNRVVNCDYAETFKGGAVIRYTPKVMDEASEEYVHGKLSVTGNSFEKAGLGTHVFNLEYLCEAEITGNCFDAPYVVKAVHTGNVKDENNNVNGGI